MSIFTSVPTTTATHKTPICDHLKIPGIDADFCRLCRVWYPADVIARHKPISRPEPPKSPLSIDVPVKAPSLCEFCSLSVGTLLCDGEAEVGTCDRLMCRQCAGEPVGVAFVCQRPMKKSTVLTRDLCPACRKQESPPPPDEEPAKPPPESHLETLPDEPVEPDSSVAWWEAKANVYLQTMNRVAVSTTLTPEAKRHEIARLSQLREEALAHVRGVSTIPV